MPIYVEKATRKGITEEAALALKGQGKVFVYPDDIDPKVIKADLDNFQANQELASSQNQDGALGRGALQGATLGFADELAGGMVAAVEAGRAIFDDRPVVDTFKEVYADVRDSERSKLERDRELNPNVSIASNIAGSLITPGGILKGAKSLAGLSARSGATGAAQGFGYSEGDNIQDIAKDTAVGAVIGAAAPSVVKGGTELVKGAGKAVGGTGNILEKAGAPLQTGTTKTGVRRAQTKLSEEIDKLNKTKTDIIDEQAILKSDIGTKAVNDPKLRLEYQRNIAKNDKKLRNIDTTIKTKERQFLKEQSKIDPDIKVAQDLASMSEDSVRPGLREATSIGKNVSKQVLKKKYEDTIINIAKSNKGIERLNNIVDLSAIIGTGIATGNPITGVIGAASKSVIQKILKDRNIDLNVAEIGINGINKLKSFAGSVSKLTGKTLQNLNKGITDIADNIPEAYKPAFERAFTKGGNTAGVYHYYLLTTDPKYRETMNKVVAKQGKTLMFNDKSTKELK